MGVGVISPPRQNVRLGIVMDSGNVVRHAVPFTSRRSPRVADEIVTCVKGFGTHEVYRDGFGVRWGRPQNFAIESDASLVVSTLGSVMDFGEVDPPAGRGLQASRDAMGELIEVSIDFSVE